MHREQMCTIKIFEILKSKSPTLQYKLSWMILPVTINLVYKNYKIRLFLMYILILIKTSCSLLTFLKHLLPGTFNIRNSIHCTTADSHSIS